MDWVLLPQPRQIEVKETFSEFDEGSLSVEGLDPDAMARFSRLYAVSLAGFPVRGKSKGTDPVLLPPLPRISIAIDSGAVPHQQGYELTISSGGRNSGVTVVAHDEAGLFYAAQTLNQIGRQASARHEIPALHITDWPDFPNRGVMLDISRDKVPTMDTIRELVDLLAEWKINQFQLYTEHTFAYKGHHVVWQDASPMTPRQVRDLDAYCRDRFIQLVPNQNSFGHMNRWLPHEPYRKLAEVEGGSDLCPVDPGSIELISDLYNQLLPNFSSSLFNVGCDETWSLGKGRSKEEADSKGLGQVYLEFLHKIDAEVKNHDKTMQFWGDIILNHPELIPELPLDCIALAWGYEAGTPYNEKCSKFAEAGVRFYVCPGTSSWNSLLGRTENAVGNLRNAAENGLKHGAEGYLITDWGDNGHWQFLPVSYLGYAYGAGVSWCLEKNGDMDVPRVLDVHAFHDSAGVMGKLAYDLGNAYLETGVDMRNNTVFYQLLLRQVEVPMSEDPLSRLTQEDLTKTIEFIDAALASLPRARMQRPDDHLIKEEFALDAYLARFACKLGRARLEAGGVKTSEIPKPEREELAAELESMLSEYRQLWLARNRSGGLRESTGRLGNLLGTLRQ